MDMAAEQLAAAPLKESPGLDDATEGMRAESLAEALQQVESAQAPAGVDPALYAELQAELVRVIREAAEKGASIPPSGEKNEVTDLLLMGDDGEGYTLEWSYCNVGDYNLDGLVGVSDLTPVGMYFECATGDPDWPDGRMADGNEDGMVTVADITPIGQNYDAFIAGFNIYGGSSVTGPWTLVDALDRPAPPEDGWFLVSYDLGAGGHDVYRVVPYDGDGVEGQGSTASAICANGAQVTFGDYFEDASATIGAAGGELHGLAGSPLEGVEVHFPEGALPEDTLVTLGYNDGSITPVEGEFHGPLLSLTAGDLTSFEEPVEIVMPFDGDEETVPVPFCVYEDGSLGLMQLVDVDYEADTMTLMTMHPTSRDAHATSDVSPVDDAFLGALIGAIYERFESANVVVPHVTSFRPERDGFSFSENASSTTAKGMCAFALWYWTHHRNDGRFYGRFSEYSQEPPAGGDNGFVPKTVEEIIASRATISVVQQWDKYEANCAAEHDAGPTANCAIARCAILNTRHPVWTQITLLGEDVYGQHCLIYGFDDSHYFFYLPDSPGEERWCYSYRATPWYVAGPDSLAMTESFENILTDAEHNFDYGYGRAVINIDSHYEGEVVNHDKATLAGVVESGDLLVDKLIIINESMGHQMYNLVLDETGVFSQEIQLGVGTNNLDFKCWGKAEDSQRVPIPWVLDIREDEDVYKRLYHGIKLECMINPIEITIINYFDEEEVTDEKVFLEGQLDEGAYDVTRLLAFSFSETRIPLPGRLVTIEPDNSFTLGVPLDPGENEIKFQTSAQLDTGKTVIVENNYQNEPFTIIRTVAPATLTITSHTSGDTVQDRSVLLKGTYSEGGAPLDRLAVLVNYEDEHSVDLDGSGGFEISIPLCFGDNYLLFRLLSENSEGQLIEVPSNMKDVLFTLDANFERYVIWAELTWPFVDEYMIYNPDTLNEPDGKSDHNFDLMVYEPGGRTYGPGGSNDLKGFVGQAGTYPNYHPKYFIRDDDGVEYGSEYRFRVYYQWAAYISYYPSSPGTVELPMDFTLTVTVNEGQPHEYTEVFTGTLTYPLGTSEDWVIDGTGPQISEYFSVTPTLQ